MTASFIPGEVVAASISTLAVTVTALAVAFARSMQRVARLEEWIRIYERAEDDEHRERLARKDELP